MKNPSKNSWKSLSKNRQNPWQIKVKTPSEKTSQTGIIIQKSENFVKTHWMSFADHTQRISIHIWYWGVHHSDVLNGLEKKVIHVTEKKVIVGN